MVVFTAAAGGVIFLATGVTGDALAGAEFKNPKTPPEAAGADLAAGAGSSIFATTVVVFTGAWFKKPKRPPDGVAATFSMAAGATAGATFFAVAATVVSFAGAEVLGFRNPKRPPDGAAALTIGALMTGAGALFFAMGTAVLPFTGGGAEKADSSFAVNALGSLGS